MSSSSSNGSHLHTMKKRKGGEGKGGRQKLIYLRPLKCCAHAKTRRLTMQDNCGCITPDGGAGEGAFAERGNKNMKCKQKFQIKRQPSRGSSNKRTRVEFSQRSSGTKDDKNDGGMPPNSEASQAQALPSFGALLSYVLYVSPLSRSACCCCSDCDYFDDDGDRFVP